MKKIALIIVGFIILASCSRKNKFQVDGEINGLKDTTVYFNEMKVSQSIPLDSAKTGKNGSFRFKGTTEYPRFYQVALNNNHFINLLIRPGEEVHLQVHSSDFTDYTVKGSPGSRKVQLLDTRLRNTKHKLDSLTRAYRKLEALNASKEKLEQINKKYRAVLNNQRDSSIAFIINNMNSLASIMALYQKVNDQTYVLYKNSDLQYIKIVSDSLRAHYPQSEHVRALLANKDNLMKQYQNMTISKTLEKVTNRINYSLPEIKLPNLKGDSISLNSLEDPMILLSFWSSSSNASIQRNMELKNLYNQYHKKGFEIYQVSLDEEREKWERAVNFDQLPWINVSSLEGVNTYAARVYNVNSLPTEYLINRKREIIARNPEMYELKRRLSIALD